MHKALAVLVFVCLLGALIGGALAQSKSAKSLMLSELSAIRRDVGNKYWTSASHRAGKVNAYWQAYRKVHRDLKPSVIDGFHKHFLNLQAHLRQRDAVKVFLDVSGLQTIVAVLKT